MAKVTLKGGEVEVVFDLATIDRVEQAMGTSVYGLLQEMLGVSVASGQAPTPETVMVKLTVARCVPFVAACLNIKPDELKSSIAPAALMPATMALLNELFATLTGEPAANPQTGP